MLMLSSLAVAAPDSSQLGPYAVSFDLNTDIQYEVQSAQPIENELATVYQMRIFTDNSTSAGISVIENKDLSDATLIMHKNLMAMEMTLRGLNVTSVDDMTIDGKAGFMATSVPIATEQAVPTDTKIYRGLYWLDSEECRVWACRCWQDLRCSIFFLPAGCHRKFDRQPACGEGPGRFPGWHHPGYASGNKLEYKGK